MNIRFPRHTLLALAACAAFTLGGLVHAEPPLRVARLGYLTGTVSFSPAGQAGWVRAAINRPLTTGDRLWADTGARAELQVGGAALRLGPGTSVDLLNLDDRITQLQLTQGTLQLRVRRLGPNEVFEVDTPNLAVMLRRAGDYRIDVDPNDDATVVQVRSGQAEVYGQSASYTVQARRGYRFHGNDLGDSESVGNPPDDDLDLWARRRDRSSDDSVSARYVSSDLVGYEDLDANGTWRADREFGNVWTPSRMPAGWSPYRDGRWAWIDPWGWTWIDDAPWGYAVSHYGRWARLTGGWSWVPGPRQERAVYAPALVAFVGGRDFQLSVTVGSAAIGWFPLAPREVYRPAYAVSRPYFETINRSNAVIPAATITNVYNTTQVINQTVVNNSVVNNTVVYANQRVAGAVVAVPAAAFVQSQPVARAAMTLTPEAATNAPVAAAAAVVPASHSVQGGAADAKARPPPSQRPVITRSALPPPPIAFAAQQAHLESRPGRPMDDGQRTQLKPTVTATTPAPGAPVVVTSKAPTPTALPPATPAASTTGTPPRRVEPARHAPEPAEPRRADDRAPPAPAADPAKINRRQAETERPSAVPTDAARAEAARAEAARVEAKKAKAEAARAESAKAESAKAEETQARAKTAEAARNEARQAADARSAAAKAEAARADAGRADKSRADKSRADKSRADAARTEAVRAAEAAKAAAPPRPAPAPSPGAPAAPDPARPERSNREAPVRGPTKAEPAADRGVHAAPPARPAPEPPVSAGPVSAGQKRPPKPEPDPKDDEDRKRK